MVKIGILALQGDVIEHQLATIKAAKKLKIKCQVVLVRTKKDLKEVQGIIIPGGESTALYQLCQRAKIFEQLKKIKNIFGTCAGAIMLAKKINHKTPKQKTLALMDTEIDRNGYGRQIDSFEKKIPTKFGVINSVFIRAPRIKKTSQEVKTLASFNQETVACEQNKNDKYYLACCFHPELTSTKFHEYFLKKIKQS